MKKVKVLAAVLMAAVLFTACSSSYQPEKLVKFAVNKLGASECEIDEFTDVEDDDLEDGVVAYGKGKEVGKVMKDDSDDFAEHLGFTEIDYKNDVKDGTVFTKMNVNEKTGQVSIQIMQCIQMTDRKTANSTFLDVAEKLGENLGIDPEDYDSGDYLVYQDKNAFFRIHLDAGDVTQALYDSLIAEGTIEKSSENFALAEERVKETFGEDIEMIIAVQQNEATLTSIFGFASDGDLSELEALCDEAMGEEMIFHRSSLEILEDVGKSGKIFDFFG